MDALTQSTSIPIGNGNAVRTSRGVYFSEFRSHDADETREHITRNYGDHTRVIHGRGPFWYAATMVGTDRVIAGRMTRLLRQTLRAAVRHPTLFFTPPADETIQVGRRTHALDRSRAVICSPDQEYTRRGLGGFGLALRVDRDLLESEIDARVPGRSRRWVLRSLPVRMSLARCAELSDFFSQLHAVAEPDGSWDGYGSAEGFERAVAGWMADLLLDAGGAIPVTDLTLQRLVRLERWIDEHLGDDLTLDRLCGAAGASSRPLQKSFLTIRGQTPLEYVASRRLAAVRRRLEQAPRDARISTIALDCGFRHLGRFAAAYRAAYGESPSDTLSTNRPSPFGRATQSG